MHFEGESSTRAKWAEVYEHMRARILSCELAPSTPVSEVALAKEYNCSPTPVRDALNRLRQEGLVVRETSRRQIVQPLDFPEIRSLCTARAALECACARVYLAMGADYIGSHITKLEEKAREAASVGPDARELLRANREFHIALAELTDNAPLTQMVAQIMESSERIFRIGLIKLSGQEMASQHLELVSALRNMDTDTMLGLLSKEASETLERVSRTLIERLSTGGTIPLRTN